MAAGPKPLRVGLLGYGLAGSVFHAPLIAVTPGLRLHAVVTSDPERAAGARRDHPGVTLLPSAAALWSIAGDLDLVVVATPNRSHAALAVAAIEAGLPVVVDKPMAPTAAEARRVLTAARDHGVALTVFQNRRWDGDFLTARRLLDAGALGRPLRFESRFERWVPEVGLGWRDSGDPADAGGLLLDLGAHLVDQALQLFGPAAAVYAEVDVRRTGATVDDDAFVAITHATGVRSHLWTSALAAQPGPRLRLLGDRAGYVKEGLDVQEAQLAAGLRPGDAGYGEDPRDRWGTVGTEGGTRVEPTDRGRYEAFYAGVAAALRNKTSMPVDPADSIAALDILEAARRSSGTGTTIRLVSPASG